MHFLLMIIMIVRAMIVRLYGDRIIEARFYQDIPKTLASTVIGLDKVITWTVSC